MPKLKTVLFYLTVSSLLTTYISYLALRNNANVKLFQRELDSFLHQSSKSRKDNFLTVDKSIYDALVVDTPVCKIPDFNPYDAMAVPFVHAAEWIEDCKKISYHWTYRDGTAIVFNVTAMTEDGYAFEDVNCCYKIVTREEQSLDNFNAEAENLIIYSECIRFTELKTDFVNQSNAEFLMVECSSKRLLSVINYRGFHAIAQPARSDMTIRKISHWQNKTKSESGDGPPPNIIVLGLDTTSRLNFRRNMPKSVKVLEKLGATEMMGYTKAGDHTRNAMSAMLTGYAEEDLKLCKINDIGGYDTCPFIWKRLTEASYLTAYSEDWPDMYAFGTAGFIHQPVDYYVRTLLNAAHDYGLPFPVNQFVRLSTKWCLGHQTNDELLLDYTEAQLELAAIFGVPLFTMSWSDTYPHSMDHNMIQLLDATYSDFMTRLETKGLLDNSILFFLSDHGQRYGSYRETLLGWYEDKLPNLWIRLPPRLKKAYPEWQSALEINSRRLSSPYMFYQTVNHILTQFQADLSPPAEIYSVTEKKFLPRNWTAQHFFQEILSTLTCADGGIPAVFCACYPLQQLPLNDDLLCCAAEEAMKQLNEKLPQICVPLGILQINGGAKIERMGSDVVTYVAGIVSKPGGIQIEANIDYDLGSRSFSSTSEVQRANQINQGDIKCLQGNSTFQLYCYCKR